MLFHVCMTSHHEGRIQLLLLWQQAAACPNKSVLTLLIELLPSSNSWPNSIKALYVHSKFLSIIQSPPGQKPGKVPGVSIVCSVYLIPRQRNVRLRFLHMLHRPTHNVNIFLEVGGCSSWSIRSPGIKTAVIWGCPHSDIPLIIRNCTVGMENQ